MQKKISTLQLFTPLNREEEKRKFMFDKAYNPQFTYAHDIDASLITKYGLYSDEYLDIATHILELGLEKKGSADDFNTIVEGKKIDQKEVEAQALAYLKLYGLEKKIIIRFTKRVTSRTSITWPYLNFRLPIVHADQGIIYTLHHEVATHLLRKVNDDKQVWSHQRSKFELLAPYETEEGLAAIHSHLFREITLLWSPALYYYAICKAMTSSFSELFNDLKTYIASEDARWIMCVRVKRGIEDTSVPGAFHKDQIYLRGVLGMLRWLNKHDYDPRPLYIGKIAAADLEKAQTLSPGYAPIIPVFLREEKLPFYKERLQALIKENTLGALIGKAK